MGLWAMGSPALTDTRYEIPSADHFELRIANCELRIEDCRLQIADSPSRPGGWGGAMGGRATSDNFGSPAHMQRRRLGPNIVRGGNRGVVHGEMGALKSADRSKRAVPEDVEIESEHEIDTSATVPGTDMGFLASDTPSATRCAR